MQMRQGNTLASLVNARSFLDRNADALTGVVTPATRQKLDDAIAELTAHAESQNEDTRAAQGVLETQRRIRQALLRDHMNPIAKIARLELPHAPGLVALTLPSRRPTLQQLAGLADGMAEAARPYADVFISAGRKPDFIEQLKQAAMELRNTATDHTKRKTKVREATVDLGHKLSHGRKVVVMLDALIRSALADQPGLLEGWNLAKRVRKVAVRTSVNGFDGGGTSPDIIPPASARGAAAA